MDECVLVPCCLLPAARRSSSPFVPLYPVPCTRYPQFSPNRNLTASMAVSTWAMTVSFLSFFCAGPRGTALKSSFPSASLHAAGYFPSFCFLRLLQRARNPPAHAAAKATATAAPGNREPSSVKNSPLFTTNDTFACSE